MAAEKELILRLTDNVTKTSSLNLELSSKLKISEGEIESYKKLLSDYQKELFEMKNKHINEVCDSYSNSFIFFSLFRSLRFFRFSKSIWFDLIFFCFICSNFSLIYLYRLKVKY